VQRFSLPGYRAHAGVEFQPTSNLSPVAPRLDSELNSLGLPGASFSFGGRR
jgi:hypothetical protein